MVLIEMFDPRDGKNYTIKDLKIVYHEFPDRKGKMRTVKCVEYTVIGRTCEWPFWMKYKTFKKANPNIDINI